MYIYGQNVIKERERKREGRKGGNREEVGVEKEEEERGREGKKGGGYTIHVHVY